MKKQFIWYKTLSTGLIGFVEEDYWNEISGDTNPDYQKCNDSDKFWEMRAIASKNNQTIHAMGGNIKLNNIIDEIRKLKSLDEIDDLIERIKRL